MGKNYIEGFLRGLNVTDEDDFEGFDTEDLNRKEKKKKVRPAREKVTEEIPRVRKEPVKTATVPQKTVKPTKAYEEEDMFETDLNESKRERIQRPERTAAPANRVVPLRSASASKVWEVSIMKPTRFDDSQDICDMLLDERATVVNLEGIDLSLAQRIMDFISGAVYALNGKIHQISNLIFIISPENVDISGDYLSYVEQNGFEVPTLNR